VLDHVGVQEDAIEVVATGGDLDQFPAEPAARGGAAAATSCWPGR